VQHVLPLRRLAILPALVSVCALTLTACGGDGGDTEAVPGQGKTADRLDAVTISGDVGTTPDVTWKASMDAGKIETETISEGDGPDFGEGQSAMAQLWIGNGFSKEEAFSTYTEKRAELLSVGDTLPEFLDGVEGAPIGSRLAVTGSADEIFGEAGNAQLGIGNKDSVLIVVDLVSPVLSEPDGATQPAPDWMPTLNETDGKPSSFSFDGAPQPTEDLRRVQLIQGTGDRVKKGQTIAVDYLGQAFGGEKPFDENFSKDAPTAFGIGTGQVIKGWDQALEGVPVGSRVVLEIPPALAYGEEGQPDSGIPANATLVFVIDVLGAA
jgi:peptidylprolyl isomerase